MIPGIIYRLEVKNIQGDITRCDISDNATLIPDDETPSIVTLKADGDPLHISVIDNDEDKLTPIRAKQATIQFHTDGTNSISTFADGADNRFTVDITFDPDAAAITMFNGFLVTSELQQYFLPSPVIVTLVATDHLGTLKDVPLTLDNGENPKGKYKIGALIALCLKKTGLSLPISVINNLRHGTGEITATNVDFSAGDNIITIDFYIGFFYEGQYLHISSALNTMDTRVAEIISGTQIRVEDNLVNETATIYNVTFTDLTSGQHIYDVAYLDALTFESGDIGVSLDCYEVLQRILGESCVLTQYRGVWWIIRIDEYAATPFYVAQFDADGVYQSIAEDTTIEKSVGAGEAYYPVNADNLLRLDRPKWFAKETYRYDYPQEIVCNIDYTRGDEITPPDLTAAASTGTYDLDCWALYRQIPPTTQDNTAYIERKFVFGIEDERYIVIGQSPTSDYYYLESEQIPVDAADGFDFSVDKRWEGQVETGTGLVRVNTAQVRLYGNDGTRWTLHAGSSIDPTPLWVLSSSDFSTDNRYFVNEFDASQDDTEWRTAGFWDGAECPNIPVTGFLTIVLVAALKTDQFRTLFSNINFTYKPLINGSYAKITGEYEKVTRAESGYLATREKDVYIKDAPKALFKGAMFLLIGSSYVLTWKWYPANLYALGYPSPDTYVQSYGWHQVFGAWNQVANTIRKFSSSIKGIGAAWPDIIHNYSLTDADPETNNRKFLLISMDQNLKTAQTVMTLVEVARTDIDKDYTSPYELKYITK